MTDFLSGLAARLTEFTSVESAIARHCFRALLSGRPAAVAALAGAVGHDPALVRAAVDALCRRGHLAVDAASGTVTVARGLSSTPTPHRLTTTDATVHACCAVDAVAIPAALRAEATVDSRCETCLRPLRIVIRDGAVLDPTASVVVWAADMADGGSILEHT
jgi:alkylmercury lyase-like protein